MKLVARVKLGEFASPKVGGMTKPTLDQSGDPVH